MTQSCKTCKYWFREYLEEKPLFSGLCKRFPLQSFAGCNDDHECTYLHGQWVNMSENEWCGEWKERV